MRFFRVSKYNPQYRNSTGVYVRDEWTEFSDIGRTFQGVRLTFDQYAITEAAYIAVVKALLSEANVPAMKVGFIEVGKLFPKLRNRVEVSSASIPAVVRDLLRGTYWCRLSCSTLVLDTGSDFYLHIGLAHHCPKSFEIVATLGLFAEEIPDWRL
jgi:hypothetical protein